MTILKEFSWCKEYGIECLKIALSEWSQSVTIYDSYKIKKRKHMKEVIEAIKRYDEIEKPVWLQIAEWRAHNFLYYFKYQINRTQHVNLDSDMNWKTNLIYCILSLFYFNF